MKKFIKITLITLGAFLIMLALGSIIFGPTRNDYDHTASNSTSTTQESTETVSESTSETQVEAKPNASKQNLEKAYTQLAQIEQKLAQIKDSNYQIDVDQQREIAREADTIDVSGIDQNDLTDAGWQNVVISAANTNPVSSMSRAITNLYSIASGASVNGDEEDNFNGNFDEFQRNLKDLRSVLDDDSNWEGAK